MTLCQTKHAAVNDSMSLAARLSRYFDDRPDRWINGLELARVAGSYAWRTRVSNLRRAPYHKHIQNRVRRVRRPDGSTYLVSEYRFSIGAGAADGVSPLSAAV